MFGWLLGKANKKILLIKIKINKEKIKCQDNIIIDTNNATYYTNEFKIIKIIDEYLNEYISVDTNIIINEKTFKVKNLKIDELYENTCIFFFTNKIRALQNIYLHNDNSTGIFKQYLTNGSLQGEISLLNGKLYGLQKNYCNNELVEECEYKNNLKNGLCKKYSNKETIIEFTRWKNGLILNQ